MKNYRKQSGQAQAHEVGRQAAEDKKKQKNKKTKKNAELPASE